MCLLAFVIAVCVAASILEADAQLLNIDISGVTLAAQEKTPYSSNVMASGGNGSLTFAVFPPNALPSGLSLNFSTGVISGAPSIFTSGNYFMVFSVSDQSGNSVTAVPLTISVGSFWPSSLGRGPGSMISFIEPSPQCETGVFCRIATQVAGGLPPYNFFVMRSGLPPGLTWNGTNGSFSGTPTGPNMQQSLLSLQVTALPAYASFAQTVGLLLVNAPLTIDATLMQPTCDMGWSFASRLLWTGGPSNDMSNKHVVMTSGSLPPGVIATNSVSFIQFSGIPTVFGTFTSTYQITDYLGGTASRTYIVHIIAPPTVITSGVVLVGQVGMPYTATLAQTGGLAPLFMFSVHSTTPLPIGLQFNGSSLLGIPFLAGSYSVIFTAQAAFLPLGVNTPIATGAMVPAAVSVTITIHAALTASYSLAAGAAIAGTPFSTFVAATGGAGSNVFSILNGTLPTGLFLNPTTGSISGAASAPPGSYPLTFLVTDALQARSTVGGVITVASGSGLSIGAIVGIALGATVFVAAAVLAIYIIHRKWTSGQFHKPLDKDDGSGIYYKF